MDTFSLTVKHDNHVGEIFKWICLFIFLVVAGFGICHLHKQQLQKLGTDSYLLKQKSLLVSKMHNEMLLMSRIQLQILHANNENQIKSNLNHLSELVSSHLIHYHQLKNIVDISDADLLMRFKIGIEKWHSFNKNLLDYANVVSDTGFLNTLSMIDVALNHIDSDSDDAIQIIAQLKLGTELDKVMKN